MVKFITAVKITLKFFDRRMAVGDYGAKNIINLPNTMNSVFFSLRIRKFSSIQDLMSFSGSSERHF